MNSANSVSTNFKNLKNITIGEIILVVLILLYLISNVSTPYELAPYINNVYTYFSLIAIVILLFLKTNPIIAIFFGIAAIVFVTRSNEVDHGVMAPSTHNKSLAMINLNTDSNTNTNTNTNSNSNVDNNNIMNQTSLEEELIGSIQKQPDNIINTNSYHPVSCETHNASTI
jgi:anthranilate/para-aminobenzoate synthase component II